MGRQLVRGLPLVVQVVIRPRHVRGSKGPVEGRPPSTLVAL